MNNKQEGMDLAARLTWVTTLLILLALGLTEEDSAFSAARQSTQPSALLAGTLINSITNEPVMGAVVTLSQGIQPVPVNLPSSPTIATGPQYQSRSTNGAQVEPVAPVASSRKILRVMTDEKGRFTFSNVADASPYRLSASANGYLDVEFGQTDARTVGRLLYFGPAAAPPREVVLRILPLSVVSGRILDSERQPLSGIQVQLFRYSYVGKELNSINEGNALSDDRGQYRIFGVKPGTYFLVAGSPHPIILTKEIDGKSSYYGWRFYPGVVDANSASRVETTVGTERSGIDVVLTREELHRIQGRVIDNASGKAPPAATIQLVFAYPAPPVSDSGTVNRSSSFYEPREGTFSISGVRSGLYMVTAVVKDTATGLESKASSLVRVSSADVEDIVLRYPEPTGTVMGSVTVDEPLVFTGRIPSIDLRLYREEDSFKTRISLRSGSDGTIRQQEVLPGVYHLSASIISQDMNSTTYVAGVLANGTEVGAKTFVIGPNSETRLNVRLGVSGGEIRGIVSDGLLNAVPGVRAVLIPDGALRAQPDRYHVAVTDASGSFAFKGVAPGAYKVFSWESLEEYGYFDKEVLARSEQGGTPVTVSVAGQQNVSVRLILRPK